MRKIVSIAEATPFLKWVGGKGKLRSKLERLMPEGVEYMRHVEPFVGGGAMFFHRRPQSALLADANHDLINTYGCIRDELDGVLHHLRELKRGRFEDRYYEVRSEFNAGGQSAHERAAMFIYLNKTCFNGVYRVNRSGEFNVPIGKFKSDPLIYERSALSVASRALKRASLFGCTFTGLTDEIRRGDFVYFDPPYVPVSETSNFTSYTKEGFTLDDQRRLRDVFVKLDKRGAKLMLSNSDTPLVRELYSGFKIHQLLAQRSINASGEQRGYIGELVVRNYGD